MAWQSGGSNGSRHGSGRPQYRETPYAQEHRSGSGSSGSWGTTASGPNFRYLSPEDKLKRRKEEREAKKERDRTLSYFTSVKRALDDYATSGTEDPSLLSAILEGFFTELIKRLKADPTLNLMRNGTVCRVIEQALANSFLLQAKTLLFVFLGHISELVTSPVASYVMETLLAGIAQGLSSLAQTDEEAFEQEMLVGGPGSHTSSGVPSAATLISSVTDEIVEALSNVVYSEVGARALRSIILVMGGYPVRNAPALAHPVRFVEALERLAEAIVYAIEHPTPPSASPQHAHHFRDDGASYGHGEKQAPSRQAASESPAVGLQDAYSNWIAASQQSTTSFLIQSLLRTCDEEHMPGVDRIVRCRMESLRPSNRTSKSAPGLKDRCDSLFTELLVDQMGCHVFQAYLRVPAPSRVLNDANAIIFRRTPCGQKRQNMLASIGVVDEETPTSRRKKIRAEKPAGEVDLAMNGASEKKQEERDDTGVFHTCWDRALDIFLAVQEHVLRPESDLMIQVAYVLQDFAAFAPTPLHLERLWQKVLQPRLELLVELPGLNSVLVRFTRKCAYDPRTSAALQGANGDSETAIRTSKALLGGAAATTTGSSAKSAFEEEVRKDQAQGAVYFGTPLSLRKEVGLALFYALKGSQASRQVARTVLVEAALGDKGFELVYNVLRFGKEASSNVTHSIVKMRTEDLVWLCMHPKGTHVVQQLLRSSASTSSHAAPDPPANRTSHTRPESGGARGVHDDAGSWGGGKGRSTCHFFLRRMLPHLQDLVENRYAAFVVECLFEVAEMDVKEELVDSLVPLYQQLRDAAVSAGGGATGEKRARAAGDEVMEGEPTEEGAGHDSASYHQFVARKVMQNLRVEQYVHRPDDWRKMAQRMCQVQRLVQRMLLTGAEE